MTNVYTILRRPTAAEVQIPWKGLKRV
jgi:hypothetical protein